MLLTGYTKNISPQGCNPGSGLLECVAALNEDIHEALPYLNASLGGHGYVREPASVSFKINGKLLTVYAKRICVNALKSEEEADSILEWIVKELNEAWENRGRIEPKYEDPPKPSMVEILKFLPKTNCRECGLPTCTVFAAGAADGLKDADDCPPLTGEEKESLARFLSGFVLAN